MRCSRRRITRSRSGDSFQSLTALFSFNSIPAGCFNNEERFHSETITPATPVVVAAIALAAGSHSPMPVATAAIPAAAAGNVVVADHFIRSRLISSHSASALRISSVSSTARLAVFSPENSEPILALRQTLRRNPRIFSNRFLFRISSAKLSGTLSKKLKFTD